MHMENDTFVALSTLGLDAYHLLGEPGLVVTKATHDRNLFTSKDPHRYPANDNEVTIKFTLYK